MNKLLKKAVLYLLAFLALFVCSVFVFWIFGTLIGLTSGSVIWNGFKTAILAFIILLVINRFSKKKT